MSVHSKQIAALKLAVSALEQERRRNFAVGEGAYQRGVRQDILDVYLPNERIDLRPPSPKGKWFETGAGLSYQRYERHVTGELFRFAEDGHTSYMQYTLAIQELEDLIDILGDPGVTRLQRTFEELT